MYLRLGALFFLSFALFFGASSLTFFLLLFGFSSGFDHGSFYSIFAVSSFPYAHRLNIDFVEIVCVCSLGKTPLTHFTISLVLSDSSNIDNRGRDRRKEGNLERGGAR